MITNITQRNMSPAFTARLFNDKGQQIKAFEMLDNVRGIDLMANRGDESTDIFVKEFISEKNHFGGYDNSARVAIENPLFGRQEFIQELCHETNSPIKGNKTLEFDHLDLLTGFKTNYCKDLENKALKMCLIDEIKKNINCRNLSDINPESILLSKLASAIDNKTLMFYSDRIFEFQEIARKLLIELIQKGIKEI